MFRGVNPLSVDSKGRLAIPAKYRRSLSEPPVNGQTVLTIDRDRCLLLYPLPIWEEVERKLIRLSSTHSQARALKRLLLGHAEECCLDAGGRILLPAPLRTFADLEKKAVLVGQGDKFEIWNEQAWDAWRDAALSDTAESGDPLPDLDTLAF